MRPHEALELRAAILERAGVAPDERGGELGALPEVVMIGLGHRRAEAPLELRLQRRQLLALALQAAVLGEVEMDLEEADVRHARQVSVCSTCFVS